MCIWPALVRSTVLDSAAVTAVQTVDRQVGQNAKRS
jgi:hypothetical protein